MNLDQFTIENEARAYRQRRLVRAEHERRLALLGREPSPLAGLPGRLAMHWSEARRGARSVLSVLLSGTLTPSPSTSVSNAFHEEE